jgi:hypothetical protein
MENTHMTVHELKPDNQYGYFDNRAEYDEWYEKNLHLHPSQIRMDGHTYDDETNEVVFKVRPTNEEVRAVAFDAPPWVQGAIKTETPSDETTTKDGEEKDKPAPKPKAPKK